MAEHFVLWKSLFHFKFFLTTSLFFYKCIPNFSLIYVHFLLILPYKTDFAILNLGTQCTTSTLQLKGQYLTRYTVYGAFSSMGCQGGTHTVWSKKGRTACARIRIDYTGRKILQLQPISKNRFSSSEATLEKRKLFEGNLKIFISP